MPERIMPGLGLRSFYDPGQSDWGTSLSEDLRRLSAVVQLAVLSRSIALPATGTAGDIYIVPAGAAVQAGAIALWDGAAGSESWVYITPAVGWQAWVGDEAARVRFDGAAWRADTPSYDFGFFAPVTPTADQLMGAVVIARQVNVRADFAGARGHVDIPPAATFTISVTRNGTEVGTIAVSTTGVFTFSTGGLSIALTPGDIVRFIAPSQPDTTVEGLAATIVAALI